MKNTSRLLTAAVLSLLIVVPASAERTLLCDGRPLPQPGPSLERLATGPGTYNWLGRYESAADYYLGSAEIGDTFAVYLFSRYPIELMGLYAEFSNALSGSVEAFAWKVSDALPFNQPSGLAPERGQSNWSPIGEIIAGPKVVNLTAFVDWVELLTFDDLKNVGYDCSGIQPFFAGFVVQSEGIRPLADQINSRSAAYTWFGGPSMSELDSNGVRLWPEDWGGYSTDYESIVPELMLYAETAGYF